MELIKALIKAQSEFPAIPKTKEAVGRGNSRYMYAPLGVILEHVTPVLNKHGLCVSFSTNYVDGKFGLVTELLHSSGDKRVSFTPIQENLAPQEFGQHLTYKKRYSLTGLIGTEAEDDTDAQDTTPDPRPSIETTQKQSSPKPATDSQRKMIHARLISIGLPAGPSREVFLASATNKRFIDELTMDEVNPLLKKIAEYVPPQPEDLPF